MNVLRAVLLCWTACVISAVAEVRMVDVVKDETFTRALEKIGSQVKDSASCKKVVKELNREADRLEKLWREAFMSGAPTTQEWCQMADWDIQLFRKIAESRKQEKKRRVIP